jgi:LPXTG-motif cell wall-anchored protein
MTILRTAATVFGIGLLSAALLPRAKADDFNRETVITFSGPVEIPGVHMKGWGVLPAGTYVFKIMDSQSDRHIVQIFSQDKLTVYATILAIPNYRLTPTDKTVMTFRERPAGEPEALRAWFYPGRNWGEEFVYPKAKAVALAKVSNVPVMATVAELPVEVEKPEAPEVVAQLKEAPVIAVKPTGEEVEVAQVVRATPDSPPALEAADQPAAALPATASSMPLIALFGLLAIGGALVLGRIEKRIV